MAGRQGKCGLCGGAIVWLPLTRYSASCDAYDAGRALVRNPRSGKLTERVVYTPHLCKGDMPERKALATRLRVLARELENGL